MSVSGRPIGHITPILQISRETDHNGERSELSRAYLIAVGHDAKTVKPIPAIGPRFLLYVPMKLEQGAQRSRPKYIDLNRV